MVFKANFLQELVTVKTSVDYTTSSQKNPRASVLTGYKMLEILNCFIKICCHGCGSSFYKMSWNKVLLRGATQQTVSAKDVAKKPSPVIHEANVWPVQEVDFISYILSAKIDNVAVSVLGSNSSNERS